MVALIASIVPMEDAGKTSALPYDASTAGTMVSSPKFAPTSAVETKSTPVRIIERGEDNGDSDSHDDCEHLAGENATDLAGCHVNLHAFLCNPQVETLQERAGELDECRGRRDMVDLEVLCDVGCRAPRDAWK